jgi:hypothetical protein
VTPTEAADVIDLIDRLWPASEMADEEKRVWQAALSWRSFDAAVEVLSERQSERPSLDQFDAAYRRVKP